MAFLRDLFLTPAIKMSPEDRARAHRIAMAVSVVVLLVGFLGLAWVASLQVEADSWAWPIVILARLAAVKAPTGIVAFVLALGTTILGWKAFLRSPQAKTIALWSKDQDGFNEPESVRVQKTANQGIIFSALLLGSLIFWATMIGGR